MSLDSEVLREVREALQDLPELAVSAPGRPPAREDMFFPRSHGRALDPDVALVVGNRGMGKSFWANALAQMDTRQAAVDAYGRFLADVEARFGFASGEGSESGVNRVLLASVDKQIPADVIWRTALIRELPERDPDFPSDFASQVDWVIRNPDRQLALVRIADRAYFDRNRRFILLFDQLEQLADDWRRIQELTKGLLTLALAIQSYRALRVKIFMRPDQYDSPDLFHFPDGSKIKTGAARLSWRAVDLYGLLFFELLRRKRNAFHKICCAAEIDQVRPHPHLRIPVELVEDETRQKRVVDIISGPFMGKTNKRGIPYTWIPLHLADARREVAPRTFLRALRQAAQHTPAPTDSAIDYHGIFEGVRQASEQRLRELEEDYPWVSAALEPLRGLQVPAEVDLLHERWIQGKVIDNIASQHQGAKGPLGLELMQGLPLPDAHRLLQANLQAIGVMEVRANGKIDIPDIFRVRAGILRKGGVTPQQRRRL